MATTKGGTAMKRKMFAALALSATLAMGAVPAFAVDAGTVTPGSDGKINLTDGQETVVSVKTVVGQIDATIPTKVVINASTDGGAVGVPSADSYKIINNSIFDLQVSGVSAASAAGWGFKPGSIDQVDGVYPAPSTSGNIGDIYMTLAPKDKAASAFTLTNTAAFSPSADWKIPAKSNSAAGELGLQLGGTTSKLSQVIADDKTSDAMTITFTVSTKTIADPAA